MISLTADKEAIDVKDQHGDDLASVLVGEVVAAFVQGMSFPVAFL